MSAERLKYARDLLDVCFVPQLTRDIGSISIQKEYFEDHRKLVAHQLPLLYDFVQQHADFIFCSSDRDAQEVYGNLLILLCEVTTQRDAPYKQDDAELVRNANVLLQRHMTSVSDAIEQIMFEHYRNRLQQNQWMRNLGCIYGFERFLESRYGEQRRRKMTTDWITFCLSVAMCVRESHEPFCKQIGNGIFCQMLESGCAEEMRSLNIHSVIYESMLKDIHYMPTVAATKATWDCLCSCLDLYDNLDSFSWSKVDDLIEGLVRNITLAPNSQIAVCLWSYIARLCVHFSHNRHDIEKLWRSDLTCSGTVVECRRLGAANTSHTTFRWAKRILELLIVESYRLLQDASICNRLLLEMHKCYIVYILPISLAVVEPHLIVFFEKFAHVLMEVAALQKQSCATVVKQIVETFVGQLEVAPNENARLSAVRDAFRQVLRHKTFE